MTTQPTKEWPAFTPPPCGACKSAGFFNLLTREPVAFGEAIPDPMAQLCKDPLHWPPTYLHDGQRHCTRCRGGVHEGEEFIHALCSPYVERRLTGTQEPAKIAVTKRTLKDCFDRMESECNNIQYRAEGLTDTWNAAHLLDELKDLRRALAEARALTKE